MRRWLVYTEDYAKYSATETDPPEYGADVVELEAENRRDALMLGVQEMQRLGYRYVDDNRCDRKPPWAGVKVEEIFPEGGQS